MIRGKRRREENWKVPLKRKPDGCIIFCHLNGEIFAQKKNENAFEQHQERDFHEMICMNHWKVFAQPIERKWWTMNLLREPHTCACECRGKRDWTWQNVAWCFSFYRSLTSLVVGGLNRSSRDPQTSSNEAIKIFHFRAHQFPRDINEKRFIVWKNERNINLMWLANIEVASADNEKRVFPFHFSFCILCNVLDR